MLLWTVLKQAHETQHNNLSINFISNFTWLQETSTVFLLQVAWLLDPFCWYAETFVNARWRQSLLSATAATVYLAPGDWQVLSFSCMAAMSLLLVH